jgi:hypothetical protein
MAALGTSITFGFTLVCTASPGQIDGGRGLPRQIDVGLAGGDHGVDNALYVAAGQNVRFHFTRAYVQSRAAGLNSGVDDRQGIHLPQPHPHQVDQSNLRAADPGSNVQADELEQYRENNQKDDKDKKRDAPENDCRRRRFLSLGEK